MFLIQRAQAKPGIYVFDSIPKCFCHWWFVVYILRTPFLATFFIFQLRERKLKVREHLQFLTTRVGPKSSLAAGVSFQVEPSRAPASVRTKSLSISPGIVLGARGPN